MAVALRFLVVDGYAREGREALRAFGAITGGELYAAVLQRRVAGAETDILCPADSGAALSNGLSLADYDGVVWTGSSLTVHKPDVHVTPQIELARAVFAARVPSFGSCWAAQVAVVAAGGSCAASPKGREIGFARKIALTPEGRGHPLFLGKRSVFDSFASHDDEITHMPPGGLVLAANHHSQVQAVSVASDGGTFWGFQYHPEFDLHVMARLCDARKEAMIDRGFFADLEAAGRHIETLDALHQDPSRKDLAWQLGIGDDILNEDIRLAELDNWVDQQVLPRQRTRV